MGWIPNRALPKATPRSLPPPTRSLPRRRQGRCEQGPPPDQVRRVNDLITEITAASKEQAIGISQVGQAVSQLDEMTQQNAAMVEQSSAAAGSMREQAQRLMEAIRVFSV